MKNGKHTNDILVSTIIPSYNKHHFLKEALFSVLDQSHENQEIIIINDYPTEEEKEQIAMLKKIDNRIKVLYNTKNLGVSRSRNKGITMSKGKDIAFLDDDDIRLDKDKLSSQLSILENDANIAAVGTQYKTMNVSGDILRSIILPTSDDEIRKIINFQMPMLQSSIMAPRNALLKSGLYNPRLNVTEDYDLVVTLGYLGKLCNTAEYQTLYRINEGLTSTQGDQMPVHGLKVVLEKGHIYPRYISSILYRYFVLQTKGHLTRMLSKNQIDMLKKIKKSLLPSGINQSYNHTDSQDATLVQ